MQHPPDNKHNSRNRTRRARRAPQGPRSAPNERNINWLPKVPRQNVAQSQLVRLGYFDVRSLAPGTAGSIVGWLSNSLYTPYWVAGAAGSNQPTISGLTAFASQYAYYRVLGYKYSLQLVNIGTNTVQATLLHTNSDAGLLAAPSILAAAAGGDGATCILAPSSNGSPSVHTFRGSRKCAAIVGKTSYFEDDQYGGVTGGTLTPTIPNDRTHITLSLLALALFVTVTYEMHMTLIVELYNRMPQTN